MRIPFLNRPETRAGYTDAVVENLLKQATVQTASVSSLGVTEACAGLVGAELRQRNGYAVQHGYGGLDACDIGDRRTSAVAAW